MDSIKFFQDEIEIWKQKQADYRARLASMSSRHAKDPESVSIKALEQMVQNIQYAVRQQEDKEQEILRLRGN